MITQLIRQAGNLLSANRLIILTYHRVFARKESVWPYDLDADTFETHLQVLKKYFNVLPLREAVDKMSAGNLPRRSVCITFDDGYADNHDVALPLLQKYSMPATFFIATGYLNGGIMWNDVVIESLRHTQKEQLDLSSFGLGSYQFSSDQDKTSAIEALLNQLKYKIQDERESLVYAIKDAAGVVGTRHLMMTDEQVRSMDAQHMQIGAHTITHPILAKLTDEKALQEIQISKSYLENLLKHPVDIFAFPNGKPITDYTVKHVAMLKELGFKAAVSTAWGYANQSMDKFQIPRVVLWGANKATLIKTLLLAYRQKPAGLIG